MLQALHARVYSYAEGGQCSLLLKTVGLIRSRCRYAAVDNVTRRSSGSSGGNSDRGATGARSGNLRGAHPVRPRRVHRPVDYDSGVPPLAAATVQVFMLPPGASYELLPQCSINFCIGCALVLMHAAPETEPFSAGVVVESFKLWELSLLVSVSSGICM